MLLEAAGYQCVGDNGCMSDIINLDSKEIFHIPNFIINDPVFKKVYKDEKEQKESMIEVLISLKP